MECKHYKNQTKKSTLYKYKIFNDDINLCYHCDKKLKIEIFKQLQKETEQDFVL